MSFLAEPKGYTVDGFAHFVAGLTWNAWRPGFVTLHNTSIPTLVGWLDPAHAAKQRIDGQMQLRAGHFALAFRRSPVCGTELDLESLRAD
jgi:hypothetical protein